MEKASEATQKYAYNEAFCLMQYQCENCGNTETLWNSRDGVTPFIIGCAICDGQMQHINWGDDICQPDHFPECGDRVFIDMTPELHNLAWRRSINTLWDTTNYPMREKFKTKLEALKKIMDGQFHGGQPWVLQL